MLDGYWQSRGYGWLLDIGPEVYTLYHRSRLNCIAGQSGSTDDFLTSFDRIETDASRLFLHQAGDITRYEFSRLEHFPGLPVLSAPNVVLDPEVNFETLWQLFDEHYAFFELHGVDWRESYRRFRPQVTVATTNAELLAVFTEMLAPLNDGHVSLAAGDRLIQSLGATDRRQGLQYAFGMPSARISPRSTVDAISPRIADAILAPFEQTRSTLKSACNGIVSWCRLKPGIGYLNVLRLFGFADSAAARGADDLPRDRRELAAFLRQDLSALNMALDEIVTDLRSCEALVVDLRVNGGGFDCAGMAIANRFADRRIEAFSKKAVAADGFTEPQDIVLRPAGEFQFTKPVVVMTSPLCLSAGEVLALCMRALPHATIVGERTAGMLSDNLIKRLPNGWELSLSNEVYSAHDGGLFEGVGVPPNLPMEVVDPRCTIDSLRASLVATVQHLEPRMALNAQGY